MKRVVCVVATESRSVGGEIAGFGSPDHQRGDGTGKLNTGSWLLSRASLIEMGVRSPTLLAPRTSHLANRSS